ncbi:MAG: hypothetical protein R2817_00940 [Flavobacteriales bacterium]
MPVKAAPGELALFERGIGSPLLKVLNGYLGPFFGLRYLGNTACWALPGLMVLAMRWRQLEPWLRGTVLFLGLAVLIIGGAGGFNYRYALTLLPALLVLVFLLLERGMAGAGVPFSGRTVVHVLLVLATLANSWLSIELSQRMALEDPVDRARMEDDRPFYTKFDTGPKNLEQWFTSAGVERHDRVLVNNLPVYFYLTDRPGLYYWCGADQYFGPKGEEPIFRTRTDDAVVSYLADSLGTRYIFSDRNLSRYDPRFERFLESHCTLIAADDKGHTLHALKGTFGR